jgi:hypothetical protein
MDTNPKYYAEGIQKNPHILVYLCDVKKQTSMLRGIRKNSDYLGGCG